MVYVYLLINIIKYEVDLYLCIYFPIFSLFLYIICFCFNRILDQESGAGCFLLTWHWQKWWSHNPDRLSGIIISWIQLDWRLPPGN